MVKTAWHTGNIEKKKNPYEGLLKDAIRYDVMEANSNNVSVVEYDRSSILTMYRYAGRLLAKHIPIGEGNFLDLGAGTGNATLELLLRNPNAYVTLFDGSKGMLDIAKYKLHHDDGAELLRLTKDEKVFKFLDNFRKESEPYKSRVLGLSIMILKI